jgi:hypothetical protein
MSDIVKTLKDTTLDILVADAGNIPGRQTRPWYTVAKVLEFLISAIDRGAR